MNVRKSSATKEDLQNFKEEIVDQFHIISEGVISQVKQVAGGVVSVNEKLEKYREEIKTDIENKFGTLSQAITVVTNRLDSIRQDLKDEIQGVRKELKYEIQVVHQGLRTEIQGVLMS
jgi:hypothetical protein